MNSHKIATIFSFCSNDWRFFKSCIEGARQFSDQILVTVCDHFFDGSPENYALLEDVYRTYPDVQFVEFVFNPDRSYNIYSSISLEHPLWRLECHNIGRWISYFFIKDDIEYLYYCDGDEITEGKRFSEWLNTKTYQAYSAMRFSCYWYFREARYRAVTDDDMSLLIRKDLLKPEMFWDEHERMGLYLNVPGKKMIHVKGTDGSPLVHHYSWVRTREEMDKKFATWRHYWERDWKELLDQEYERPFSGVDFIRQYSYIEEKPVFDPLEVEIPTLKAIDFDEHIVNVKLFDNVRRVCRQEMFRRELDHVFEIGENSDRHQFLQQ